MTRVIPSEGTGGVRPGQELVVAGYAGLAGSLCLFERRREELAARFSGAYLEELAAMKGWLLKRNEAFFRQAGAAGCTQSGLGGIYDTLWRFSGAAGLGLEFVLRDIPVLQGTVEICESLGVNPYRLYSAGCFLLAAQSGYALTRRLEDEGVPARVVGVMKAGIAREVITEEGHAFLERPHKDEVFKILPRFREGADTV